MQLVVKMIGQELSMFEQHVKVDKVGRGSLQIYDKNTNIATKEKWHLLACGSYSIINMPLSVTVRYGGDLPPAAIIVSAVNVSSSFNETKMDGEFGALLYKTKAK